MRRLALLLAVAVTGCGKSSSTSAGKTDPPGTAAGEVVVVKIRDKQAGDKYEVAKTATESSINFGGGKESVDAGSPAKTAFTEEVQAATDGRVTKAKRTYAAAESGKFGKVAPLAFANKTVLIAEKGGKYEVTFDGGGPVGPDARELEEEFRDKKRPADLLPAAGLKVGEPWAVPAETFAALLGPGAEKQAPGAKATLTLTKAYAKDGKRYGVLTLVATLPGGPGPELSLDWIYDGCIDGLVLDAAEKLSTTIRFPAMDGKTLPPMTNSWERTTRPAK